MQNISVFGLFNNSVRLQFQLHIIVISNFNHEIPIFQTKLPH